MSTDVERVTKMLQLSVDGREDATEELFLHVQQRLRELAALYLQRERAGHTLQPTALVNEVYMKLADETGADFEGRTHFIGVAARAMRQVLVDHARAKGAVKRGRGWKRVNLSGLSPDGRQDVDSIDLGEALDRLATKDPRAAQIVELKSFGGLGNEEVAALLDVSRATVATDWKYARAWLRRELRHE